MPASGSLKTVWTMQCCTDNAAREMHAMSRHGGGNS
jgi:hypothetical protein